MAGQLPLFSDAKPAPVGLSYRAEFLTIAEERELIERMASLPFAPFQFGVYEGKRRVVYFGARYDFTHQRLEPAEDLPDWIMPYVRRTERLADLGHGAIRHALFTEYDVGAGIGWHRDKKQFDEVFGLARLGMRHSLPAQQRDQVAAVHAALRAAVALRPARAGALDVGAQHRAGGREALLDHLSDDGGRRARGHASQVTRKRAPCRVRGMGLITIPRQPNGSIADRLTTSGCWRCRAR